jgi:glycosyltransferase involved in cell wall biosynthesis
MEKIAFITGNTPFGKGETFILVELLALKKMGANLIVIPRDISYESFHKKAVSLRDAVVITSWFDINIAKKFLEFFFVNPGLLLKIINDICLKARTIKLACKNLVVLPRAVYISKVLKENPVSHIHVHWGSTTSTMAFIISRITNIPWSLTLHRWDIYENNILKRKVGHASFTRCISERGKKDLLRIIGDELASKVKIIHMGAEIPSLSGDSIINRLNGWDNPEKYFTMAVPANLVPEKGHQYLIEACNVLIRKGFDRFKIVFYGNGPLRKDLEKNVKNKNLGRHITLPGAIPHEQLTRLYQEGKIDIVILPSIITEDGDFEGIPVALMEAMGYGIPVITTNTGSIPELISDCAGIIVTDKSEDELANAIFKLIHDKQLAVKMALNGYDKVASEFAIEKSAFSLLKELKMLHKRESVAV